MNDKLSQFTPEQSGVKQFQSTNMWDEIQGVKEEALESTIAGLTFPETPTKSNYEAQDQSNPYEIQREALSRLSLLDEALQPTDTYTNYIAQGNQPIPGLEDQHETLLFLDRQQQKIQEHEEGLITEDQMLLDLYGRDILEYSGYNVMSVGWWQQKYHNNDFTTPFDNQYLMYQVTEQARQHHNTLLAKQYAHNQTINNSKLAAYTGDDLKASEVRELFPDLTNYTLYKDDDQQLMRDISSGRINAQLRIHQTPTGDRYYLHTDGRLYRLSNEGGENTARYEQDEDGNITEISINGSDIIDAGRSFVAGATSVFTSLVKLLALPFGWLADGSRGISDITSSIDAWSNDNISFLADSGRVDLDGFELNDADDIFNTLAYTLGMVAGGKAIGGISHGIYNWGTKLAESGHTLTGGTLKAAGNLWARSTGMYQGFGPDIKGAVTIFGQPVITGGSSMFLNHMFKTVPTYMIKDYYTTLNQLQDQRMSIMLNQHINGEEVVDPTSDEEISSKALSLTLINGAISTVFAGGIDDRPTERLQHLFQAGKEEGIIHTILKPGSSFFKALSSPRCVVAANTVMDFMDNFLTMSMNDYMTVDEDGAHWTAEGFQPSLIVKNIVTAAIMSHPTYDSNVKRRNVGAESIYALYNDSLKTIDNNLKTETDPQKVAQIKATRDLLVNDFKQAIRLDGSKDLTVEERALYALNKFHENIKNSQGESIIIDKLFKLTDQKVLSIYQEMSAEAKAFYEHINNKTKETIETMQKEGAGTTFKEKLKQGMIAKLSLTKKGRDIRAKARAVKGESYAIQAEAAAIKLADTFYNKYLDITRSKNAQEFEDNYKEFSTLTNTLTDTADVSYEIEKDKQEAVNAAVKVLVDRLDPPEEKREEVEQQVRSNMVFYTFKNETGGEVRADMVIRRAAASNLVKMMPDNFVKIDDNTYAFTGLGTGIQQLFTHDVYVKTILAAELVANNRYKEGTELYLSTMLGDDGFQSLRNKDVEALLTSKELLYNFLDDMIKNNVMTKIQAVKFIGELASSDSDVGRALNKTLTSKTNVNHKNVSDLNQLNPIESYLIRFNAFKILRDNTSKIGSSTVLEAQRLLMDDNGNADPVTKEVFMDMVRDGDLSEDFYKQYNELIIAISKDNKDFQITSNIERLLTDIAGEDTNIFDENKIESAVSSILGEGAPQEVKDELVNKIKQSVELIKTAKLKDAEMNEDAVVLNTTLFTNMGKTKLDNQLLNATTEEANNMIEKGTFDYSSEIMRDIELYLETSTKMVETSDPYIVLDLNKKEDIDLLNNLNNKLHFTKEEFKTKDDVKKVLKNDYISEEAKSFIIYNYGKELSTDIITNEEAAKLTAYLFTERVYRKNFRDKVTLFYNDGTVSDVDLYTFISSCIGPTYISQAMHGRQYVKTDEEGNTFLGLNPFDIKKTLEHNKDVFQGTSLEEAIKTGRIGGEAAIKLKQLYSQGDYATVNKVLSTELMLMKLVDELSSSEEKTIYLDEATHTKMQEAGIIDAEDSFYKTDDTYLNLTEKPSFVPVTLTATKEELEYYILHEKDFNLFKILPLASETPLSTEIKFNFPGDYEVPDVTGGISTVPRLPIYNVFNDVFEWDNGNRLRNDLILGIINNGKNLSYNPLADRIDEQLLDIPTVEKYKKYRAKGRITNKTDIYYTLIALYEAQDKMYIGNDTNEDFKLWLADSEILKQIVDESETLRRLKSEDQGKYEDARKVLIKQIIKNYEDNYVEIKSPTTYSLKGITYNSYYGSNTIMDGDYNTVISKKTLDSLRNIGYNFIETKADGTKGVYDGATNDLIKAVDFVVDYKQSFLDDTFTASSSSSRNYVAYTPNDDILLRTILAASDSKILIKDLDELARIDFEAYKNLFEKAMDKDGIKVAERIKSHIDNLYDQYLKLNSPNIRKILEVDRAKVRSISRTKGAATTQKADTFTYSNGMVGHKKVGDYLFDNYIKERESRPVTDMARIHDLTSSDMDRYEKLMYDKKSAYSNIYTNNPGQLEINNLSRGMNAYKVVNTIIKTSEALDKMFEESGITGVDTMALANQLHLQADGTRYMTEWAKYNLFDPTTNKSELGSIGKNSYASGKDHTDVLLLLDKPDSQLIGKVFFSLEKHSGKDNGAIKFKYYVIKNENDINDLRTAAILEVFNDNKSNNNFKGVYSIDGLHKLSPDKLLSILNSAINNSVLRKNINKRIIENLKNGNIAEENIYKILSDPEEYKTKYLDNNVKQIVGGKVVPALQSDNLIVRQQAAAITYGLHFDLMSEKAKSIIRQAQVDDEIAFLNRYWNVRSYEKNAEYEDAPEKYRMFYEEKDFDAIVNNKTMHDMDIEKMKFETDQLRALAKALDSYYEEESIAIINKVREYFKEDPQGLKKMIEGYFIYGNADAGVIYHRINENENLIDMYNKRHSDNPASDPIRLSYTNLKQDVDDLRNFFTDGVDSEIKTVSGIDFETTFANEKASSIKDIWQIGIVKYTKQEDGTTKVETSTKYVKHDNYISTKEWAEDPNNVNLKSKFYTDNQSVRDSLAKYKELQDGDPDLITEEEALKLLADNEMLIAYNGETFDFELIKEEINKLNPNMKYLDATELVKREQLDVKESAKLESVFFNGKRKFSQDFLSKAHDAEEDVKMMMDVVIEKLNSRFNLAKDKTSLVGKFEQLVDLNNNEDVAKFKRALGIVENNIRNSKGQDAFNNDQFKRDTRTLDDITYIARLFNHSLNTARGNLYMSISDKLSDNSVKTKLIDNGNYAEINKVLAFIASTQGKEGMPDFVKALYMIKNAAREIAEEDNVLPGSSHTLEVASIPNERLMEKLGLSLSAYEHKEEDENYRQAYAVLYGTLTKGKRALLDPNNIFKISPKDYQDFMDRGALDKIAFTLQDAMKDSSDVFKNNKNLQTLWEHAMVNPLTASEDLEVEDLLQFVDNNIHYKDSKLDTIVAQLENLLDDDTIASIRTQSGYKMFNSFTTHPVNDYWEIDVINNTTKRLDNILAGDIVITKALLDKIVKYNGYEELLGSDGNLYLYTVAYPSDNPNSLMAHRVRVINDMGDGNANVMRFGFTPETQAILRARDFDGDFLSFFKPTSKQSIEIASAVNKYLYNEFNVEEELLEALRDLKAEGSVPNYELKALSMAADSDIKTISFNMDRALSKNNEKKLIELTEKLKQTIRVKLNLEGTKFDEQMIEDMVSYLGVVGKFNDEVRFVNNPAIWTDVSNKAGYYSYKQRIKYFKLRAFNTTNILDSVTGYNQKLWSKEKVELKDITAPLIELYSPSIYLTDTLSEEISLKLNTEDNINKFFNTMKKSINNSISNLGVQSIDWNTSVLQMFDSGIEELRSEALRRLENSDTNVQEYIKASTLHTLHTLGLTVKTNNELNNKVLELLKNNNDSSYLDQLNRNKEAMKLIRQIKNKRPKINTSFRINRSVEDIYLKNIINNQEDLAVININGKNYDEIPDLLGEIKNQKNKNVNLNKVYLKDSSKIVDDHMRTANGFVFIAKSGNNILVDDDSIGITNYAQQRCLEPVIYNAMPDFSLELPESKIQEYNSTYSKRNRHTSKRVLIDTKTPIGFKKNDTTGREDPVYLNRPMYLAKILRDKNNHISNLVFYIENSLDDVKLKIGGMAKGKGKFIQLDEDTYDIEVKEKDGTVEKTYTATATIDFIISEKNATDTGKFGLLPNISYSLQHMTPGTISVKGQKLEGWLVPKMGVYNIGDDSKNFMRTDTSLDPNAGNRTELMLLGGQATTLTGIGGITGNAVIFKNEDGTIDISNKEIVESYEDPTLKGSLAFKNVAEVVLATRAQLLLDALDDSAIAAMTKGKFNSRDEYMKNLLSSPAKLNSRRFAMELLAIQRVLGGKKVNEIKNKNAIAKAVFDPYLDEFIFYKSIPTGMYESKDPNLDKVTSGNSQTMRAQMHASETFGEIKNQAEIDLNNNHLVQMEHYYVPWNWLYKNLSGYEPTYKDLIKGTYDGYLTLGRHRKNGGTFNNKWMPVDVNRSSIDEGVTASASLANGTKSGVMGRSSDTPIAYGIPDEFVLGEGNYDILNDFNNPFDSSVQFIIGKALNNEKVYGDYKSSRQILSILDYLVNVNDSKNRSKISKKAAIKGVKGVEYDLFNMGYRTVNDELVRVGNISSGESTAKDAVKNINSHAKTFWTYKDLIDQFEKANVNEETINNMFKSNAYKDAIQYEKDKKNLQKEKNRLTKDLLDILRKEDLNKTISSSQSSMRLTTNYKPTTEVFSYHPFSRSGIHVKGAETGLVDMAVKNCTAYGEYYKQEMKNQLNDLKGLVPTGGMKEFTDFAMYNMLKTAEQSDTPEMFKLRLEHCGITPEEYASKEYYARYKEYSDLNPMIVTAYNDFISNMMDMYEKAAKNVGEPFGPAYMFFTPYILKDKAKLNTTTINTFHNLSTLRNFDPIKSGDMLKQNLMFNFFEGSEKIINEIGQIAALDQMSKVLTGEEPGTTAMLDNVSVMDKAYEILNTDNLITKVYASDEYDVTPDVLSIISLYTDIDYYTLNKKLKNPGLILAEAFKKITAQIKTAREDYTAETGEHKTLSDVYSDANNTSLNQDVRAAAKDLYNKMWAQIVLAQRIMEVDAHALDKAVDFIDSLSAQGKVLANRFGQKIAQDTIVKPLMGSSLKYLKDNVEISLNSINKQTFAQFVFEKALSGEIYIADAGLVKQLENNLYTTKVGGRTTRLLKNISKVSAGLQMSLPTKMIGRLLRFTGFDYVMDAIANPKSIPYMSIAAREISQAMQTGGKVMTDDLREYLMREGQPSIGQGSDKDPINYTESMGITDFTNKLTRPLELQNHLGRYAIYLTAKKSWDEGKPWYGPLYHKKEAVDALPTNADKAMYIMDYLLGSPGGFPAITKKTSGLMMYATFPMNLTRTFGAYGLSLSRLFHEGITNENQKYWMSSVVIPSGMAVGISYLGAALIAAVCDMYDVDEETEKEWIKEGVWLDPIGTLIGQTPSVVYDSINPLYTGKEMFINPFTNKYNDTLPKKAYGWVQSNIISKLNPAIKTPAEILLKKDLYGETLDESTKYQYTNLENGLRKVLGFFVGSGVANAVIDENKMSRYSDDRSFAGDLWKGITNGISYDLGNQKSYKQNTSNYYAVINNIRQYRNAINNKDALYDYEVPDLLNAEDLYYSRNYSYRYGVYNEDDFKRIHNLMRKMIKNNKPASDIYALIVDEFNSGTSEATLRSVLNANSIIRRLNSPSFNKSKYYDSLNNKEKIRLRDAIEFEMAMYPLLSKFFPEDETKKSTYIPRYQRIYNGSGSSYSPSSSSPYIPRYYPGRYYPKTFYYNKKVGGYTGPNLNRVQVNVSPQMAIWNQDNNLTRYETGIEAENEPKWLRDKDYVSRVN